MEEGRSSSFQLAEPDYRVISNKKKKGRPGHVRKERWTGWNQTPSVKNRGSREASLSSFSNP